MAIRRISFEIYIALLDVLEILCEENSILFAFNKERTTAFMQTVNPGHKSRKKLSYEDYKHSLSKSKRVVLL